MKIYTRTGDEGETGLFGGMRVSKGDARVEAYGDVDELNSVLGLVRSEPLEPEVDRLLGEIQDLLFAMGAELGTAPDKADRLTLARIDDAAVERLEHAIDRWEADLPPLRSFVVPGGARSAAGLHVARTVCRRAERRIVNLAKTETVPGELLRFINRLADLLFVLARIANLRAGIADVPWTA